MSAILYRPFPRSFSLGTYQYGSPYSITPIRTYTQQRKPLVPRAQAQSSTTKPTAKAQVKNRTSVTEKNASSQSFLERRGGVVGAVPTNDVRIPKADLNKALYPDGEMDVLRMVMAASQTSNYDPWAYKMPLMDLRIPVSITRVRHHEKGIGARLKKYWTTVQGNFSNSFQNTLTMYRMAKEFAFPVLTKRAASLQIFRAQSTKPNAWVAGIREELMRIYKGLNEAIAKGDEKSVKKYTGWDFQKHATALARRRQRKDGVTYVWKYHGDVRPCKIVSIRAHQGYHGRDEPVYGNRLCVQAIARFETLQSLEVRDRLGRVLRPDGSIASPDEPPPEPKPVLQHLIFENRMYYRDGWVIREEMFEDVEISTISAAQLQ